MSRVFEISVPAERVRLGADGRGEMVFSVTNRSTVVQRVSADFAPSGATRREWLSLGGEPQRELSAGGTDQFIVNAQVPPGTAPGPYPFRLRVASANNRTSEDYEESPLVQFEMPAGAAAKKKPWWIPVAAAAVLLVVVIGVVLAMRREPGEAPPPPEPPPATQAEVPALVGRSVVDAMLLLQKNGLAPKLLTFISRQNTPNVVLQQDPPAGSKVAPGSQVTLVIAQPPVFIGIPLPPVNVPLSPANRRQLIEFNQRRAGRAP